MNFLTIGDRQHAALLASIQLWQKISLEHPELITDEIRRTAQGAQGEPLDYEETNALCRGINDGVNCLNDEFIAMVTAFDKLAGHLDQNQVHEDIVTGYDGVALYLNAVTTAGLACGELVLSEDGEEALEAVQEADGAPVAEGDRGAL